MAARSVLLDAVTGPLSPSSFSVTPTLLHLSREGDNLHAKSAAHSERATCLRPGRKSVAGKI